MIFAQDGFKDVVGCGSGIDTAQLDSRDAFGGCGSPTVTEVGKLRTVELMRGQSRLTGKGKTVTARLAFRLDKSLRDQR